MSRRRTKDREWRVWSRRRGTTEGRAVEGKRRSQTPRRKRQTAGEGGGQLKEKKHTKDEEKVAPKGITTEGEDRS